jgi:amino acid transporter
MPAGRKLSLAEIVALGIGGMVGGGIFATLGLAIAIGATPPPSMARLK